MVRSFSASPTETAQRGAASAMLIRRGPTIANTNRPSAWTPENGRAGETQVLPMKICAGRRLVAVPIVPTRSCESATTTPTAIVPTWPLPAPDR